MNFVEVCTAANEAEAFLVKGFLEGHGIETSLNPIPSLRGTVYFGQGLLRYVVAVEASKAEEAKRILAERDYQ